MTDSRNFDEGSEPDEPPPARDRSLWQRPRLGRTRAGDALDEAPLIALAGGLAAGALIAALLPRTRTEERLVRPVANRAKETAKSAARAAKEAGSSRLNELGSPGQGQGRRSLAHRRRPRGRPRFRRGGRRHGSRRRVNFASAQVLLASRP